MNSDLDFSHSFINIGDNEEDTTEVFDLIQSLSTHDLIQ